MLKDEQLRFRVRLIYGVVYVFHLLASPMELFGCDNVKTKWNCPHGEPYIADGLPLHVC